MKMSNKGKSHPVLDLRIAEFYSLSYSVLIKNNAGVLIW